MKYECIYNPDFDTFEVTSRGLGNLETMLEIGKRIIEFCLENPTAKVLVDHTRLDVTQITMNDLETMSRFVRLRMHPIGARKFAHVLENDLQFGLGRAWENMVAVHGTGLDTIETQMFREKEEAMRWLSLDG